jgi:hypothetical protein
MKRTDHHETKHHTGYDSHTSVPHIYILPLQNWLKKQSRLPTENHGAQPA